ncbi:MAG TPA: lipoyl synthase, partial [Flavobacteriaceae bacterium]|nr:lipoyl synthase [Flavobacteriaceae bacterium]
MSTAPTTAATPVQTHVGKPKWIRVKLPTGKNYTQLRGLVDQYKLNTICTSGSCPNMG